MLAFMFGFGYLPPVLGLTPLGMHALGIFIGLLWAWTAVDLLWPSLLGMVAIGLTGWCSIQQAFSTGFGDSTIILVFFMFSFVEYLQQTGLSRSIACWFISRKICIGRPWIFVLMLMLASYCIGATTSCIVSLVIGWPIFYEICAITGYKPKEKFPLLVVIGVLYCSALGGAVFPFRPIAALVINSVSGITGEAIDPLVFSFTSFAITICLVFIYIVICKFILRPDVTPLIAAGDPYAKYRGQSFSPKAKVGGIAMICVLSCNFLPSILPKSWGITVFLSQFSMAAIFATAILFIGVIRFSGEPDANMPKTFRNGVNWATVIMLASSMPLAAMLKDPATGVNTMFTTLILKLLEGASPLLVGVIFIAFVLVAIVFVCVIGVPFDQLFF